MDPGDTPFAQRLDLGWVVIGDVCLGGAHRPLEVRSCKTAILENGRKSHLEPCNNQVKVKEVLSQAPQHQCYQSPISTCGLVKSTEDCLGQNVFDRTPDDNNFETLTQPLTSWTTGSEFTFLGTVPRQPKKQKPTDARRFIEREFYVGEALKSFNSEEEAISVLE